MKIVLLFLFVLVFSRGFFYAYGYFFRVDNQYGQCISEYFEEKCTNTYENKRSVNYYFRSGKEESGSSYCIPGQTSPAKLWGNGENEKHDCPIVFNTYKHYYVKKSCLNNARSHCVDKWYWYNNL